MINGNISRINFHVGILFKYLVIIFGGGGDGQMITHDHRGEGGGLQGAKI